MAVAKSDPENGTIILTEGTDVDLDTNLLGIHVFGVESRA